MATDEAQVQIVGAQNLYVSAQRWTSKSDATSSSENASHTLTSGSTSNDPKKERVHGADG